MVTDTDTADWVAEPIVVALNLVNRLCAQLEMYMLES